MKKAVQTTIFLSIIIFLFSCVKNADTQYSEKYFEKTKIFEPSDYDRIFNSEKARKLYRDGVNEYANLQFLKAEKLFRQSLKLEQNPNTLNELGICLRATKRFEESKKCFENAIKLDSTFYTGYFSLANLNASLGENAESEKIVKLMISKTKDPLWVSYGNLQLAAIYNNQKELSKAKIFVDQAKYLENVPELKQLYVNFRDTIYMNVAKTK